MSAVTNAVLLACLCSCFGYVNGQTSTNAKALMTQLFVTNAYDTVIRPVINQTDLIHIYVEFYLLSINFLDEVTETMKTTGFLRMYWTDQFLVWDSSTYGGLARYHWPQNSVWKPDVALKNSYLLYEELGVDSLNVEVTNNGQVVWSPFEVFQSTCAIDITYFPFDEQSCSLEFVAWSYTKLEIIMEGGNRGIVMEDYERNSAWEVTNTSWYEKVDNIEASIIFVIQMKRKPLYNMLTLIFPVIMLAILNLFVFALPSEGGEKAGFAVTVFLAFAVFLTIMQATFPQNSDTTAIFAVYVVIETIQSTLITIISLLMIRMSALGDETDIPSFLICLTRILKCKQVREKCGKNKISAKNDLKLTVKDLDTEEHTETSEEKKEDKTPSEKPYTWKNVLNGLDIIFFTFFFLAFLSATMVCLLTAKYH